MAHVVITCPHCSAERITCTSHGQSLRSTVPHKAHFWNLFVVCRHCRRGIVVELVGETHRKEPHELDGDPRGEGYTLERVHPSLQQAVAPEHVPHEIGKNYVEAMGNMQSQRWTSAAMMFRKILDRATKHLDPNLASKTLYRRIERLEESNAITPGLKELATSIRLDGNDANHDEDADEQTARRLQEFTELFLIYTFTLPKRIAASQEKQEAVEGESPS